MKKYLFLKNFTSEGAISHYVLYYQQLPIARDQVFTYFELLITINGVQCLKLP